MLSFRCRRPGESCCAGDCPQLGTIFSQLTAPQPPLRAAAPAIAGSNIYMEVPQILESFESFGYVERQLSFGKR